MWGSRLRNWGEKVWALLKKEICFVYFYVWLVWTLDAMVYLCQCTLHDKSSLNPLTPKIMLVILLTSAIQFLWCFFGEFGIGSSYVPLIYIFLYSHHFSAWYCIDIVRRNSVLVTHGSLRVKGCHNWRKWQHSIKTSLCSKWKERSQTRLAWVILFQFNRLVSSKYLQAICCCMSKWNCWNRTWKQHKWCQWELHETVTHVMLLQIIWSP